MQPPPMPPMWPPMQYGGMPMGGSPPYHPHGMHMTGMPYPPAGHPPEQPAAQDRPSKPANTSARGGAMPMPTAPSLEASPPASTGPLVARALDYDFDWSDRRWVDMDALPGPREPKEGFGLSTFCRQADVVGFLYWVVYVWLFPETEGADIVPKFVYFPEWMGQEGYEWKYKSLRIKQENGEVVTKRVAVRADSLPDQNWEMNVEGKLVRARKLADFWVVRRAAVVLHTLITGFFILESLDWAVSKCDPEGEIAADVPLVAIAAAIHPAAKWVFGTKLIRWVFNGGLRSPLRERVGVLCVRRFWKKLLHLAAFTQFWATAVLVFFVGSVRIRPNIECGAIPRIPDDFMAIPTSAGTGLNFLASWAIGETLVSYVMHVVGLNALMTCLQDHPNFHALIFK
uniref:Uncharacterized protein n=1 Tax=Hemiselmis andersenii TaxID=464988 RepID=A0A6U4LVP5_HEMAN|mmetsp:Transcript_29962/g.69983  ORF Transcript_29962/g.69983 Transcript_29962/m.69983 type:complete len:399 (+) Transcript_29962:93-1289(+)